MTIFHVNLWSAKIDRFMVVIISHNLCRGKHDFVGFQRWKHSDSIRLIPQYTEFVDGGTMENFADLIVNLHDFQGRGSKARSKSLPE